MTLIPLTHAADLHYPRCREVLDIHGLPAGATVLTFARVDGMPSRVLDAGRRLPPIPAGDIALTHFDHSPLYALLLWDITLAMPTGSRLYLYRSDNVANLLARSWYREAFRQAPLPGSGWIVCTKLAPLPAEAERGLDAWSFCLPTGGDDEMLNTCVGRILELNVPDAEIILCGKPGPGFRFPDRVRVVGNDIPDSPVHITRKKNALARAARHPNLCILHDRVLLPLDFMSAVRRFGDDFPLTGFQSFWFADTWQAVPRRYSDFCVASRVPALLKDPVRPDRACLPAFEKMGFCMQHPRRASFGEDFLTGSLYLCKRSVWQHLPQNESLFWAEYEDVEHGIRAALAGIPSRVNPWALTQTLRYRSIFHMGGYARGVDPQGRTTRHRAPQECWGFPRRPSLPVTQAEGRRRLAAFARRYTGSDTLVLRAPLRLSGLRRYRLISRLLRRADGHEEIRVRDWFHLVLCEAPAPPERDALQAVLNRHAGHRARMRAWLHHPTLLRQIRNNLFSPPFLPDSPPRQTKPWRRKAGMLLSALYLTYACPHAAFRLSWRELWGHLNRNAQQEDK